MTMLTFVKTNYNILKDYGVPSMNYIFKRLENYICY